MVVRRCWVFVLFKQGLYLSDIDSFFYHKIIWGEFCADLGSRCSAHPVHPRPLNAYWMGLKKHICRNIAVVNNNPMKRKNRSTQRPEKGTVWRYRFQLTEFCWMLLSQLAATVERTSIHIRSTLRITQHNVVQGQAHKVNMEYQFPHINCSQQHFSYHYLICSRHHQW